MKGSQDYIGPQTFAGGGGGGGSAIAEGSYIGNGAPSQPVITGLTAALKYITLYYYAPGFPPVAVIVNKVASAPAFFFGFAAQASPYAFLPGTDVVFAGVNFTADVDFNVAGVTYHWAAWS